jgi:hypothetical protein
LSECTFKTESNCTFKTGPDCTFKTGPYCTFDTEEECVVVRRDVYEIIELKKGEKIKLNEYKETGYTVIQECEKFPECHQVLKEENNNE